VTRIAVLGAGAWGRALAGTLRAAGNAVALRRRGEGFEALEGSSIVLLCVPAAATREVLSAAAPALAPDAALVVTAKGLEPGTRAMQTEIAAACAPAHTVAVLSGPGFAAELERGLPVALTLASADAESGAALQRALATPALRPYLSDDPAGAQLGGALKNVMAIACGAAIGAGLGESARAALITRGFAEMSRLAAARGARAATLAGLSGLGDLTLTCTSAQSRNFSLGLAIGRGGSAGAVLDEGGTYEGARTAEVAVALAAEADVETPIAEAVAALVAGRLSVAQAVDALFNRPLTRE
jgi:glycerol-3-phosphate dehydrogenase (NAD(P)+)